MLLPKWKGIKKNCGNGVAENWRGEREREKERENCLDKKKIFWILILKSTHILILSVCQ